jgi:hypothetical protein
MLVGFAAPAGAAPAPTPGASATAGGSTGTDLAAVASSLATDPLYVSTDPGTPTVEAGDIRGALPPDVAVAVLPASSASQVGGEKAALPGAILGRLPRTGTVLVLAGTELDAASRTQPYDRVQQVVTDARSRLAADAPIAPTLVVAARGLSGGGQLSDPPAPSRAGSPSGSGLLWVILAIVVVAILAIPVTLRRARRAAPPPPRVLRDRVEVDAYGRVVRRVTVEEQAAEQECGGGSGG